MMASEWNPMWPAGTMRRAGRIGKAEFYAARFQRHGVLRGFFFFCRCESRVEAFALLGHIEDERRGREARAVAFRQPGAQLGEVLRAHHVDIGKRAAAEGRE